MKAEDANGMGLILLFVSIASFKFQDDPFGPKVALPFRLCRQTRWHRSRRSTPWKLASGLTAGSNNRTARCGRLFGTHALGAGTPRSSTAPRVRCWLSSCVYRVSISWRQPHVRGSAASGRRTATAQSVQASCAAGVRNPILELRGPYHSRFDFPGKKKCERISTAMLRPRSRPGNVDDDPVPSMSARAMNISRDSFHILVVEDDPGLRRILQAVFLREGHRVSVAADGADGLRIAKAESPDLMVSDVMMPKMDGREMLRRLKSEATTRNIPVIFLSAMSKFEDRIAGLDLGAIDYIEKPYEQRELLARVRNILQLIHSERPVPRVEAPAAFISYRHPDRTFAERLARDLRRNGISTWFFPWSAKPGIPLTDAMQHGIDSAEHLLLVMSEASLSVIRDGTGGISFEVQIAEARKIRGDNFSIIGIRIDDCLPPAKLQNPIGQWVDFIDVSRYEDNLSIITAWLFGADDVGPPVIPRRQR